MLGTDLVERARKKGRQVSEYVYPAFDITNQDHVLQCVDNADVVINCAAYTDVEGAQNNEQAAMAVNAHGVQQLAQAAAKAKIRLIHISTDFVFDGKKAGPYIESDIPNPVNVYGKSKLQGEKLVQSVCPDAAIIRIEWTYGKAGINFVQKVLSRARQGQPLKIVSDQVGSPTWTRDVSDALLTVAENFQSGIYHFAAGGYVSRFDLAKFILDSKNINAEITPCMSDDFPSAARRPANSRFDCSKIQQTFGVKNRPWQEALAEFLEKL